MTITGTLKIFDKCQLLLTKGHCDFPEIKYMSLKFFATALMKGALFNSSHFTWSERILF